jgi:hypothetical protein
MPFVQVEQRLFETREANEERFGLEVEFIDVPNPV